MTERRKGQGKPRQTGKKIKKAANRQRQRRRKKRVIARILAGILAGAAILALIIAVLLGALMLSGKSKLRSQVRGAVPDLAIEEVQGPQESGEFQEASVEWQEGWIRYDGKIYAYNEDILTFLVMGIDKKTDAVEVAEGQNGGQADALFLVVADPHEKAVKIIGINRNTMTEIDFYDEKGRYRTTGLGQICIQHGFGNGVEESCEYQKKAVQSLFYNLPVHGYAAINMSAISTLNDAVGGVDVTVLEDLTARNRTLVKGETVHLMGESAFWYVKYRDTTVFGSADMRLERQKQYLKAFAAKAKEAVGKDPSVALDLYNDIRPQMVTDITADEVVYLASALAGFRFEEGNLYTLKGETVQGEKYEEFYADEDALYQLIIEVFYEEVEPEGNGN